MNLKKIHKCFILSGSNQGNRNLYLQEAENHISKNIGAILRKSSVYETEAWGNTEQPSFYNKVLELEMEFSPEILMNKLLEIEKDMGRVRTEKWSERIIDLDILFIDNLIIQEQTLTVPHPHLHKRAFTLIPMAELEPKFIHPVLQKTIAQLLNECEDHLTVKKLNF